MIWYEESLGVLYLLCLALSLSLCLASCISLSLFHGERDHMMSPYDIQGWMDTRHAASSAYMPEGYLDTRPFRQDRWRDTVSDCNWNVGCISSKRTSVLKCPNCPSVCRGQPGHLDILGQLSFVFGRMTRHSNERHFSVESKTIVLNVSNVLPFPSVCEGLVDTGHWACILAHSLGHLGTFR